MLPRSQCMGQVARVGGAVEGGVDPDEKSGLAQAHAGAAGGAQEGLVFARLSSSKILVSGLTAGLVQPKAFPPPFTPLLLTALETSDKKALRVIYALLPRMFRVPHPHLPPNMVVPTLNMVVREMSRPLVYRRIWGARVLTSCLHACVLRNAVADARGVDVSGLRAFVESASAQTLADFGDDLVLLAQMGGGHPCPPRVDAAVVGSVSETFLEYLINLVTSLEDKSSKKSSSRLRTMFGRSKKAEPGHLQAHAFGAFRLLFPRRIEAFAPLIAGLGTDDPLALRNALAALVPYAEASPTAVLASLHRYLPVLHPPSPHPSPDTLELESPLARIGLVRLLTLLLSEVGSDPHADDVVQTLCLLALDPVPAVALSAIAGLATGLGWGVLGGLSLKPETLASSPPLDPSVVGEFGPDSRVVDLPLTSLLRDRLRALLSSNDRVQLHKSLGVVVAVAKAGGAGEVGPVLEHRVRALTLSSAIFVATAAVTALVWLTESPARVRHVLAAVESLLRSPQLSPYAARRMFVAISARVFAAPHMLGPAGVELFSMWITLAPQSVTADTVLRFYRKLIKVGSTKAERKEYKELVLSAVLGLLDTPQGTGALGPELVWWLGEFGNYLTDERESQYAQKQKEGGPVVCVSSSHSPAMRAIVARLEIAVSSGSWDTGVAAIQALGTLGSRSGDPVRLHIYEFLRMAANDPVLGIHAIASPILAMFESEGLGPELRAGDSGDGVQVNLLL